MAVQPITGKRIIKYDTSNPNYKEAPKPKVEVSGNVRDDEDVYGERKHTYTPEPNGNLQMEELMGKVLNKLDNIPGGSQTGTKVVSLLPRIVVPLVDTSLALFTNSLFTTPLFVILLTSISSSQFF